MFTSPYTSDIDSACPGWVVRSVTAPRIRTARWWAKNRARWPPWLIQSSAEVKGWTDVILNYTYNRYPAGCFSTARIACSIKRLATKPESLGFVWLQQNATPGSSVITQKYKFNRMRFVKSISLVPIAFKSGRPDILHWLKRSESVNSWKFGRAESIHFRYEWGCDGKSNNGCGTQSTVSAAGHT